MKDIYLILQEKLKASFKEHFNKDITLTVYTERLFKRGSVCFLDAFIELKQKYEGELLAVLSFELGKLSCTLYSEYTEQTLNLAPTSLSEYYKFIKEQPLPQTMSSSGGLIEGFKIFIEGMEVIINSVIPVIHESLKECESLRWELWKDCNYFIF